jgi:vacuolar-type H+-ATPase subunit E/Vma4
LKEVKDGLFKELEAQLKKGILLQASDEVKAGFTISFDAGKSQFEFTDRSLAEYISKCLRPDLAEILES